MTTTTAHTSGQRLAITLTLMSALLASALGARMGWSALGLALQPEPINADRLELGRVFFLGANSVLLLGCAAGLLMLTRKLWRGELSG